MDIQRIFTCDCGAEEKHEYEATPTHCGRPMTGGKPIFPNLEPGQHQLHMVRLRRQPKVDWQLPGLPDMVCELWELKPAGRGDPRSEFLGFLGKRATTWEWVAPRGVAIRCGFAPSGELAAQCLVTAIEGGLQAKQVIARLIS